MFYPTQLVHYEQTEILLQAVTLFIIVTHMTIYAVASICKLVKKKKNKKGIGALQYSKMKNYDSESTIFKPSDLLADTSSDE